jgi:F420-dependent oxidoreductase-like protein
MELGLHNANLTFSTGDGIASTLARIAREAEAAGIARLTVMDHVWQISAYGPPEHEMLEAYTALGFLAAHTEKAMLHAMVTSVVYRTPGMLAKQVTTLDVLSGGRAALGIGAAWNEEESRGLGLDFPPLKERFERLDETIRICLQMWSDSEEPFEGEHYTLERTLNSPQSVGRDRPYLLIGGSGERKTLRLVAKYADGCNIFTSPETAHKLDVLRAHCDELGRDYDTIEKTTNLRVSESTTHDELLGMLEGAHALGFTVAYISTTDHEPLRTVDLVGGLVAEAAAL